MARGCAASRLSIAVLIRLLPSVPDRLPVVYDDNMVAKRQQFVKSAEDQFPLLVADIYEAAGLLRRAGDALAQAQGQTQARWQLLSVISDQARTVPQAARRLGVSRQAVQRVANELAQAGLAAFESNPEHKTSPLLHLTPAGKRALERISGQAALLHQDLALGLDVEEIDHARRAIRTLIERLTAGS